jgi:hypothetical protein
MPRSNNAFEPTRYCSSRVRRLARRGVAQRGRRA